MTDDPKQLRELARWFAAAAHNTSDPHRPRPTRVVVNVPIE